MQNKLGHYYLVNFLSSYSKKLNPGHHSDTPLEVGFQLLNRLERNKRSSLFGRFVRDEKKFYED